MKQPESGRMQAVVQLSAAGEIVPEELQDKISVHRWKKNGTPPPPPSPPSPQSKNKSKSRSRSKDGKDRKDMEDSKKKKKKRDNKLERKEKKEAGKQELEQISAKIASNRHKMVPCKKCSKHVRSDKLNQH